MKIFALTIVALFLIILSSCGGGGGSSSSNIITIPSDGFIATADNKIEGGQKDFAFGQTATFEANGITNETWSTTNGSITSIGQYITPKDLSEIISDDITMSSSSNNSTRTINLSPFPFFNETYFKYNEGNQKYSIQNLTSSQAICVATFQNESISSAEGNIKIKNLNATNKKSNANKKLRTLMGKDKGYQHFENAKKTNRFKYTSKKNRSKNKRQISHKALDPLGTRETFYSSFSTVPGYHTFEKQYSGEKCLVYSEINSITDLPFVEKDRSKAIGDAFEIANPYHPSQKPIFDVVASIFGNPWGIDENGIKINDGGNDGEEQIIILLYEGDPSIGGYFYSLDEEPKGFEDPDTGETSNGAELINLNQIYANDDITIFGILAHEFQHLCNYNQLFVRDGEGTTLEIDPNTDEALFYIFDEGLSVLSEDLNGFSMKMEGDIGNATMFIQANMYLSTISTASPHFISWASDGDYGKGYLFWRFIYDTYGESAVKIATHSHLIPTEDIELATGKKFDVIIQEFILAIMQSDSSQPIHSKYKISTINRSIDYFDSEGFLLGNFLPTDYIEGFPNSVIKNEGPFEIRLYKLLPSNNEVSFTLENIKALSSYSIFTAIIDK